MQAVLEDAFVTVSIRSDQCYMKVVHKLVKVGLIEAAQPGEIAQLGYFRAPFVQKGFQPEEGL